MSVPVKAYPRAYVSTAALGGAVPPCGTSEATGLSWRLPAPVRQVAGAARGASAHVYESDRPARIAGIQVHECRPRATAVPGRAGNHGESRATAVRARG